MPKSKKSAKKKTVTRKPKPDKQAVSYQLADELPETVKSPQQLLIRDAIKELGTANVAQIAEQIKGKLKTKQEPQRVVSFYLASWKKRGYVKAVA
jgi:hypothetical protein